MIASEEPESYPEDQVSDEFNVKLDCYSCPRIKPNLIKKVDSLSPVEIRKEQTNPKTIVFKNYAKEAYEAKEYNSLCALAWIMRVKAFDSGRWVSISQVLQNV